MRKTTWISLTLFVLVSIALIPTLRPIPSFPQWMQQFSQSTPLRQPANDSDTRADGTGSIDRQQTRHSPQLVGEATHEGAREEPHAMGGADASIGAALTSDPDDLLYASQDEIARLLGKAIEKAKQSRPLFVAPGIVEALANGERARIIFETGEVLNSRIQSADSLPEFDSLRVFPLLNFSAASVGPEALLRLIEDPGTGRIELDSIHRLSLAETIPIVRADLAHQLDYDGDGFAVAVIDTGVDPTHSMYAGRIIEEACFSLLSDCPNGMTQMLGPGSAIPCTIGGCGHGTLVAGIAVGDGSPGPLLGTAPHANLIAIQVFSDIDGDPGAYSSDILAGFQHVLGLTSFHRIASVNLSLGGSPFTSEANCRSSAASQFNAVELLRAAGVLTVAASGNEFLTNAITTPACLSNVIGVGSTSDSDVVSSFSNSTDFLEMLAPGESVTTSSNGGGIGSASGTSMAAPHVAGAIATILEALPDATVDEIENALVLSGVAVLDTRNGETTPRLQVQDAIDLLVAAAPPPPGTGEPPPSGGGSGGSSAAATTSSGGGGGGCGLVGIEPFLVLGLIRLGRRSRRR